MLRSLAAFPGFSRGSAILGRPLRTLGDAVTAAGEGLIEYGAV